MSRSIGENLKKLFFFLNYLPLQIWTLKCSLNSLTLQFCRYDVFALPTPVLNLATFMYKHPLGGSGTPRPKTISARDSSAQTIRPILQSGTARPT